jgi:RHS repeat-associated protein
MVTLSRKRGTAYVVIVALVAPYFAPSTASAAARPARVQPSPSVTPPIAAGTLAGQFDVTPSGTARYSIPLAVAAGRSGVQPEISLSYDSSSGDGPVGVGWKLTGFSQIERCASTPATQGRRRPVKWDNDDALCMDGQPLIRIAGEPFADGAEYRALRQNFRRIVGIGTPHTRFRVYLPDGRMADYGDSDRCAGLVGGCRARAVVKGSIVRSWAFAAIEDRFGNWMRVEWETRASPNAGHSRDHTTPGETAEHLPRRMRYTGSTAAPALAPQRLVEFEYEPRPDQSHGYTAGTRTMRTRRLTRIVSTVSSAGTFREYRLAYATSRASNRSLLSSVTACAGDGSCMPPTTFRWEDRQRYLGEITNEEFTPILAGPGRTSVTRRPLIGGLTVADVNGDGRSDLVYVKERTGSDTRRTWRLVLAYPPEGILPNGNAPALPPCSVTVGTYRCEIDTGIEAPPDVSAQALDYDRDGRTDLLVIDTRDDVPRTTWKVLRSTGNGLTQVNTFVTDARFDAGTYKPVSRLHLADVNGDGGVDLLTCEPRLLVGPGQPWHVRYHTGDRWGQDTLVPFSGNTAEDCRNHVVMVLDASGDGVPDLLVGGYNSEYKAAVFTGPSVTYQSTGISTIVGYFWQGAGQTFFTEARSADVNGDGLSDVIADRDLPQSDGTLDVWLNTGAGFASAHGQTGGYFGVSDQARAPTLGMAQAIDYNGDRRGDLLISTACPPGTPASISGPCSRNPRWQILQATGAPVQYDIDEGTVFTRRELNGCTQGGGWWACLEHRTGPHQPSPIDRWFGYQQTRVGDVDGDLLPDLIMVENDHIVVRRNGGPVAGDRIVEIKDGLAGADTASVRITYKPSTDGAAVESTTQQCSLPVVCERPDRVVVASHAFDAGAGHEPVEIRHTYARPRRDSGGAGWLGFKEYTVTNTVTGAFTSTTFHDAVPTELPGGRRAYPLALQPSHIESVVPLGDGRQRTVVVDYTWNIRRFDGTRTWYTNLARAVTTTRETIGNQMAALSTTSTTIGYDSWGNPDSMSVDTGLGVTTVTTQYRNDSTGWLIGLPRRLTVMDTVNGETLTRVTVRDLDDQTGRVMSLETGSPVETTATFEYDTRGNPIATVEVDATTGFSRTTRSSYATDPEQMYPANITDPLGRVTRLESNRLLGVLAQRVDPNGLGIRFTHDGFGRVVKREQKGAPTVEYLYRLVQGTDGPFMEVESIVAGGPRRVTRLDRLQRPVRRSRTLPDGRVSFVDRTYDRHRRLAARSVPYVGQPSGSDFFTFDALDRPLSHVRPDGSSVSWTYRGLLAQYTDSLGHRTQIEFDAQLQPILVTDHSGGATKYEYGPFGTLRRVSDAGGNVTEATVDARGRVLAQSNPDTGEMRFGYDGFGRLVKTEDRLGRATSFVYDALDRLVELKNADGTSTFTYDQGPHAIGRLSEATGPSGFRESYEYDEWGRPVAIHTNVDAIEGLRKVEYDEWGRLISLSVSAGDDEEQAIFYDFAEDGSVRRIRPSATASPLWTASTWNERGDITHEFVGSRVLTIHTIDPLTGRLNKVETIEAGSQVRFQDLRYEYDTEGNVIERSDAVAGTSEKLEYDFLDRVTASTLCQGDVCGDPRKIDYDALGNIVSKWDVGSYEYDSVSPHAVTRAGPHEFEYDVVGNQIRIDDETRVFTARNLPSRVERPGSGNELLDYDAFGRLARRRTDELTTVHFGRGFEQRTDSAGTTSRLTIDADGRTIAVITRQGDKATTTFVHPDALGSPTLMTDEEGKVAARTAFDLFGQPVASSSSPPAPLPVPLELGGRGYTGHRQFDASALVHMGGRSYDPRFARFLSADPFVPLPYDGQSLNRYSYARNNPLRYVDPTGFEECSVCDFEEMVIEADDGYDDLDEGDRDQSEVEQSDDWDPQDDLDYDDGGSDPDDGSGEPEENGGPWDFDGFEVDWSPEDFLEDLGTGRDDVVESVDRAIGTLTDEGESDFDTEDVGVAVGVVVTTAVVLGGAAIIYGAAKSAIARGLLGAGAGALGQVPPPIDFGAPRAPDPVDLGPGAQTRPVGLTPDVVPPDTFQPPNGGINYGQDFFGKAMANMPSDPDGMTDAMIHGWANGYSMPSGQPVTAGQLADLIRADARYGGQGVRLLSCSPGNGAAAQALANELGAPVKAVSNELFWNESGLVSLDQVNWVSPDAIPWEVFTPATPP